MKSSVRSLENVDEPIIYLSDPLSEFFVLPSFLHSILSQLYLPAYGAVNFSIYSPTAIPGYLIRTPY